MKYLINTSTESQIYEHLNHCSSSFIPSLNTYVDLTQYSKKIHLSSLRIECFNGDQLIGLIAVYLNKDFGFITNVSVLPQFKGKGIAQNLLENCIVHLYNKKIKLAKLEVFDENHRAISFYKKNKFKITNQKNNKITMELELKRDYNLEMKDTPDHKYAYNFDIDVMHNYMIKSFEPFFKEGNVLELGSFAGEFTKKILPLFDDITCVEASSEAVDVAMQISQKKINFYNSLFEEVKLPKKYDNILLTHVLEHIDSPVDLLKRINDEWLSEEGRLFLVCPNANAASRQIAVKMGLVSHNAAITPAEEKHGHRITYSLDTLERDVRLSGLKIRHTSGIFFKALSNFQWDELLKTNIISKEYLDGCYELGKKYPDLCSSILIICEKG